LIASAPALLLVYKDVPAHSVAELIALMKASKEPYQVGTPGAGTVNYLASVLFAQQAGVAVQQIPEKGSNPLITDMMGGFVKVGFNPIPVSRAALDGGYIRALAVTSQKHSTLMPQLPTLAESGLLRRCPTVCWRRQARRGRSSTGSTGNCAPRWQATRFANASSMKAASPSRPHPRSRLPSSIAKKPNGRRSSGKPASNLNKGKEG
jgi:hypothetical protein